MIDQVAELNRVLSAIASLAEPGKALDQEVIIEACQRTVIEGRMPDHSASLNFANHLGLASLVGGACALSEEGCSFLSLNPGKLYDLTEEQKKFLVRAHYLGGVNRRACKKLFGAFSFSQTRETFRWSEADGKPLQVESWLIGHLCELNALVQGSDWLEVHPDYAKTIAAFIEESVGLTEEKLREILKEKEEVGEIAERVVLEFERNRLKAEGFKVESSCVRRVGKVRVNLGYDIESFNGGSSDLVYDRLIEVKGAKGQDVRFFWSDNEIKVAAQLRDKYWIYFQGGINVESGQARNDLVLFRDPTISIKQDERIKTTSQGLLVEGKLRGARK